jgi:hypothetical protein
MQKLSLAVAVLIGAVAPVKINWAQGLNDDELEQERSKFDSFAQTTAASAAKTGSGVRAKWVELPDCQGLVEPGATFAWKAAAGEVIPLEADLSNAIIATCKGAFVAVPVPTPSAPAAITTNIPVAKSQIYDPVWKTSTVIPDHEHQVSQLQNGKINATDQTTGPAGDFYTNWKYTNGQSQPYQEAGNSWSNEGPGGNNSTTAATSPTNYGPNPTPAVLLQFLDVPTNDEIVPTENSDENKWVELPDCTGAAGEVPLFLNHENATSATCKKRPWDTAPVPPAAPAATMIQFLDVPTEDVVIPIIASETAQDNENKWVELPNCTGAADERPLFLNRENASSATCKSDKWDRAPVAPAL